MMSLTANYCCCHFADEGNKPRSYRLKAQMSIIMVSSLVALNHGMSISHAAVLVPQIQAENGTLQIDEDEASWIASLYSFASPLGAFVGGVVAEFLGRRLSMIIALASMAIGWITIFLSQNVGAIMGGRVLEGLCKTMASTAVTILTDETIHPAFRGFIFSNYGTMLSVGIFAMMGLATLMSWRMSSLVASAFSAVSCLCVLVVPESPTWLVRKNQSRKAEQALNWLLGHSREQQVKEIMLNLRKRYTAERDAPSSFAQRIAGCRKLMHPNFLKPFLIIHGINVFIQLFCGNHLVINYSVDIVSRMAENQDPYFINTVLSLIRTLVCLVVGLVMSVIGRRTLMMISGVGTTIAAITLAAMLFPGLDPPGTPEIRIALLGAYVACFTSGYFIVPTMMIGETQPAAVRGFLCGYIFTVNDFTAGGVIKGYPWLLRTLGLHGMFLMFGISCVICALMAYLFLPETKGKTLEEIEDYFKQKNIMWITRDKMLLVEPEVQHLHEDTVDLNHRGESLIQIT